MTKRTVMKMLEGDEKAEGHSTPAVREFRERTEFISVMLGIVSQPAVKTSGIFAIPTIWHGVLDEQPKSILDSLEKKLTIVKTAIKSNKLIRSQVQFLYFTF